MKITEENYNKIPNGKIGYVVLTGDEWEEDMGKSIKIIKFNDLLYEIKDFYIFSESSLGDGYEFDVIFNQQSLTK